MKVLVTGASGFLGTATVDAMHAAGHEVVALVRPTADTTRLGWSELGITTIVGDLRQPGDWTDAVKAVDAVVHLAAAPSGGLSEQFAGTVLATERLLGALDLDALTRFVHVSSLSVYDFTAPATGGALDESTLLEPRPAARDAYTITKLEQERLVRETVKSDQLVVVRPGAIYGPGKEWDHGAALRAGRFALVAASGARMRLTFVTNCADALVAALVAPGAAGGTFNVVDDDLPTHGEFFRACRRAGATPARGITVPWAAFRAVGLAVHVVNRLLFRGRARLPEVVDRRRQTARWRPLNYPNVAARTGLKWKPRVELEDGVAAMVAGRRP